METETATIATVTFDAIDQAYRSQAWPILAGLVIMLIVRALSSLRVFDSVDPRYKRVAAIAMSGASAAGSGLALGARWDQIMMATVSAALSAVGWHEYVQGRTKKSEPEIKVGS